MKKRILHLKSYILNHRLQEGFIKFSKRSLTVLLLSAIILTGTGIYYLLFLPRAAEAAWFDDSWSYRQRIDMTYTGSAQTDFQIKILANVDLSTNVTAGKIQSDLDDLRFTDTNGKLLKLWLEDTTTSSVDAWVIMSSAPAGNFPIYMYYGNPSATAITSTNGFTTGGTITFISGYRVHSFTSSGTFNLGSSRDVEYLVVAGGGGGASKKFNEGGGGGGGAGGMKTGTSSSVATGSYTITVGAGGAGATVKDPPSGTAGSNGSDSSFGTLVTSTGGGGGGGLTSSANGAAGGSGGGGGFSVGAGGAGTGGEGNNGGTTSGTGAAGGGGAGAVGSNTATSSGGAGGAGTSSSISGSAVTYAGGGGGGAYDTGSSGAGGSGGGGGGGVADGSNGVAGTANTGGGGGGAHPCGCGTSGGHNGGNGGSGIVVLRYAVTADTTAAAPTNEEKAPAPFSYWNLDDGTGTTAQDSSPNNNDGTLTSGPTWQTEDQCISGKCVYFDGTNDYIDTNNVSQDMGINSATPPSFSISAWFKPLPGGQDFGGIQMHSMNSGVRVAYRTASKVFTMQLVSGSSSTSTAAVTEGQWNYVVGMYDATDNELRIYLNGNFASETTPSITDLSGQTADMFIGHAGNYFKGFIDEVKVYPSALSAAQVKANYTSRASEATNVLGVSDSNENLSNGLVGYWKMDESTTAIADSSGNAHTTAVTGSAMSTGKFGNTLDFGGTSADYAVVTDAASLDFTTQFTVSAWIYRDADSGGYERLISKDDSATETTYYWYLQVSDTDKIQFGNSEGGNNYITGSTSIATGTWYHVIGVYDGTQDTANNRIKLYINSASEGTNSGTHPTTLVANTGDVNFGRLYSGGYLYGYNGKLDETRLYNRALSSAEVSQLYNFAPGPIAHYKMDEKTGTSANDSSGNGSTGTLTNSPTWVAGKYGGGLKFNNSNTYVNVTENTYSNFNTTQGTASMWVTADLTNNSQDFLWTINGDASTPAQENISLFKYSNNLFYWRIRGNGGSTSNIGDGEFSGLDLSSSWKTGQLNHLAVTWSNVLTGQTATVRLYLNGVLMSTKTASLTSFSSTFAATYPMKIGASYTNAVVHDGTIDELRIYNYERSAKQIVEDMNAGHPGVGSPVASAVGHWKFDEGADGLCSGGTNDTCNSGSGGSTLDGTVNSMASPATSTSGWSQSGKFGRALAFDGSDDYVSITDNAALDLTTGWTIGGWFRPNETVLSGSDRQALISKWQTSAGTVINYTLLINTAGKAYVGVANGTSVSTVTGTTVLSTATWYHLMATFDATSGNLKVYVNGILEATTATGFTAASANSGNVRLGQYDFAWTSYRDEYNGIMDEVKIYGYALTTDEIKLDMNRGASQVLGTLSDNSSYQKSAANQEYCVPGDSGTCTSPVARYDFNEGSGTTAYDQSGNSFTGTLTQGPTYTTGKFGKGVNFDGSNDYITVADSDTLDPGTGDWTAEAWFNANSLTTGRHTIVQKVTGDPTNGASMGDGWIIHVHNNYNLRFSVTDGASTFRFATFDITGYTGWHHVAGTWTNSGNSAKLYVDGVLKATNTSSGGTLTDLDNTTAMTVGVFGTTSWPYAGTIDNVRIFNDDRTAAQIAWDYNRGGPVGWWKMDECQGTTANDSSGNANSGTITIGASGSNTSAGTCASGTSTHAWYNGVTGKRNYSLDFDGTDDYVTIADPSSGILDPGTNDFSISVWVELPLSGSLDWNGIVSKGFTTSAPANTWGLNSGNPQTNLVYQDTTAAGGAWNVTVTFSTSSLSAGFHHVVVTRSGTAYVMYVDGISRATGTGLAIENLSNANALQIGNSGSRYFNNQIDDVRMYNYKLTPTQVRTLFNEFSIFYGPATGSP